MASMILRTLTDTATVESIATASRLADDDISPLGSHSSSLTWFGSRKPTSNRTEQSEYNMRSSSTAAWWRRRAESRWRAGAMVNGGERAALDRFFISAAAASGFDGSAEDAVTTIAWLNSS